MAKELKAKSDELKELIVLLTKFIEALHVSLLKMRKLIKTLHDGGGRGRIF